jgi:hypothetical protein
VATVTEHSVPVNRYVTGPWRYERIEAVDHWVPGPRPRRLNRLLLEFLES